MSQSDMHHVNKHNHTLYIGRSTQGTLSKFSLSIFPILAPCLIIFAIKFYYRKRISLCELSAKNNHATMSLPSPYNHHVSLFQVISSTWFMQASIHVVFMFVFVFIFLFMCSSSRCSCVNSYNMVSFYVNKINYVGYLSSCYNLFKHYSYE